MAERIKIEKVERLVVKFLDKEEYVIHIGNLKQPLNHGLVLEKMHIVIKFNRKAWLKSYIDMNTELRQKARKWFLKTFFQVNEQCSFWKNYGEYEKTWRYQACNRKKLFKCPNQAIIQQKLFLKICQQ